MVCFYRPAGIRRHAARRAGRTLHVADPVDTPAARAARRAFELASALDFFERAMARLIAVTGDGPKNKPRRTGMYI